jgi:hypothetical protein
MRSPVGNYLECLEDIASENKDTWSSSGYLNLDFGDLETNCRLVLIAVCLKHLSETREDIYYYRIIFRDTLQSLYGQQGSTPSFRPFCGRSRHARIERPSHI